MGAKAEQQMTFSWTCNAECTWFECEPGDGWRLKIMRRKNKDRLEYWQWNWVIWHEVSGWELEGQTDNLSDAFAEVQLAYRKYEDPTP